ncbi:Ketoreductase [Lachnellula suecica]|uniref:Ketoreductase n=1 Tax=Lachnellula suecica TaxID=602035 RepID=A0A8T9CHF1_9HELO|nr:Ketoreductase [Lachnellula suecica]
MPKRVLLTGGNGFIGSHILSKLLEFPHFSVRCTVRSEATATKLKADFHENKAQLETFIVPIISTPGAYNEAVKSDRPFDLVIHTASPFGGGSGQSNFEFLDPSIKGTTELLQAVKDHAPQVTRVVYLSSSASILDFSRVDAPPAKVYTEADWNPVTWEEALVGDEATAYRASKKFAEQAAWKFMDEKPKPKFDFVTLCPPATFGPPVHSVNRIQDLNESNARLWKLCNLGTASPVPRIPLHVQVDARDLAVAHIRAALIPSAGNKRIIISGGQFNFQEIFDIVRSNFKEMENRTTIGNPGVSSLAEGAYEYSNSQAKKVLGVEFRPFTETLIDTIQSILDIEKKESR